MTESTRKTITVYAGSADDLKRQFLRALVRGEWGIDPDGCRYREVAEWLSGAGFPTSETAVKNARRGSVPSSSTPPKRGATELVPHSVAATEKTLPLLHVIMLRYPTFQYWTAFVAGHVERVEEFLISKRITPSVR